MLSATLNCNYCSWWSV